MAQNTLLPVSLSKKNSSYKLSTDIVNLNTTNAISFGSIGDWKKWRDKIRCINQSGNYRFIQLWEQPLQLSVET